jgi:hypothetical protein
MSSAYDTKERFTLQLVSKVKSYILSFNPKPPIIDPDAFVKHLYYYAFNDYLRKSADKFNLRKSEIFEFISKAVHLAIAEINRHFNLYKLQDGRYYLCV